VRLDLKTARVDAAGLHGQVIGTDGPFGNLVLNVPAEVFRQLGYQIGDLVPVTLAGKSYTIPFVKTFSDVPVGKELFYIDSRGGFPWHRPGQLFDNLQGGRGRGVDDSEEVRQVRELVRLDAGRSAVKRSPTQRAPPERISCAPVGFC